MYRCFAIALTLIVFPCFAQQAEIVWVGHDSNEDEPHLILYNAYVDDQWAQDATVVYSSSRSIVTPFLTTDFDGSKVLFWSEERGSSNRVLMIMRGRVVEQGADAKIEWSAPTLLYGKRSYNIGPIAVRDGIDRLWLFWTANDGKDSDIFQSYKGERGWSEPELAHPDTDVPELHPMAYLLSDGELEVSWSAFDPVSLDYVEQSKRIAPNSALAKQQLSLQKRLSGTEELSEQQVRTPVDAPYYQQVHMHFPGNLQQQFSTINNNQ